MAVNGKSKPCFDHQKFVNMNVCCTFGLCGLLSIPFFNIVSLGYFYDVLQVLHVRCARLLT